MLRSHITFATSRRRREVYDGIGYAGESREAPSIVEIARNRTGPEGTQMGHRLDLACERIHPEPADEPRNRARGNIATPDNQNSFHFRIISRHMPFQISTEPGGQSFAANSEQTILEAALTAGLLLPYGCRDGACGACKAQILHGAIDQGDVSAGALTPAERLAGMALLCKAKPLSDVVLKVRTLARVGDIPVKKLPCRVQSLERAAPDVVVLKLKLPASEQFRFRAGQYIDFLLDQGRRRSFSIANPPDQADHLELHVRLMEGGRFTTHIFEKMKEKDILRFEGPLGSFFLREDTDRPVVLIAGGTGFAPIKSIVEHVIISGKKRRITLYWGARNREGLYMHALAQSWAGQLDGFSYVPVLSEARPDDAWDGREGLVHHAVMADLPDLAHHEVYICGAPGMIDAARSDLTIRCNLPEDSFFADAFTFASDPTT